MPTSLLRLGRWCRALLLATSLIAVAVHLCYRWFPATIDGVDLALERWLRGDEPAELHAALAAPTSQTPALVSALEHRWRGRRHGEHGFETWRQAAMAAGNLALASDDAVDPAALESVEVLVSVHPQDVPAQVLLARLLSRDPTRAAEARLRIADLHQRLPESDEVSRAFLLAYAGDATARAAALAAHVRGSRSPFWVVRYEAGDSLVPELAFALLQPRYTADGRVFADFRLPGGVTTIRIEPPPDRYWRLFSPRVRLATDDRESPLAPTAGLRQDGDVWHTDGGRGALEFTVTGGCATPATWQFTAGLAIGVAPWLYAALREADLVTGMAVLERQGRTAEVAELRRWRTIGGLQSPVRVYHAIAGGAFGADRRTNLRLAVHTPMDGDRRCSGEFAIPGDAARLRLALSIPVGSRIRFACTFLGVDAGPNTAVAACPTHFHDLETAADEWLHVTGKDPYFTMAVPAGADTLRINGEIP